MFFKALQRLMKIFVRSGLILSLSFFLGCGNYLGGKSKNDDVQKVNGKQVECLKEFSDNVALFVENELPEQKVNDTFTCMLKAIDLFQKKTIGSGGDSYKTKELKEFFEVYFIKDVNISQTLADEMMKFKKALVGGEDTLLTKAEIKKLTAILSVLQTEAIELQKNMPLILFKKKTATLQEIEQAEKIVLEIVKKILSRIELSESEYSFKDMKNLLTEAVNYYRQKRGQEAFQLAEKWLPLIESIRQLIIGENEVLYGKEEFQTVSINIIESYFLSHYFNYHIKQRKIDNPEDVTAIMHFAEKLLAVISGYHQMRSQNQFSFASIDQFVDILEKYNYLPNNISSAAIKELIKVLTARNFDPARRGDSRGLQAFERKHLQAFSNEIAAWMNFQFWLNSIFKNKEQNKILMSVTQNQMSEHFDKLNLKSYLQQRNHYDDIQMQLNETYFGSMKRLLLKEDPIVLTSQGKYVISKLKEPQWTWLNLSQLNTMMLLSRGLMIGYAKEHMPAYQDLRLRAQDLEIWYKEFEKIGYDLKAFDLRSKNPGVRSFYEANLFTSSANGDDVIDPDEAFDFLTLLVAGGMVNTNGVLAMKGLEKCRLKENDYFGNAWLNERCFFQVLRVNVDKVYDHLPNLKHYLNQMSDTQFNDYWRQFLYAIRVSPYDGERLETADIRTLVMVTHYIESLMYAFDFNRDQWLDQDELKAAAPRFYQVFATVAKTDRQFVLNEAFIYVVLSGKIPEFKSLKGSVENASSILKTRFSDKKASRQNLIQVFKLFKSL